MTSPEAFFALVEHHVTPAMRAAGYTVIGEYDEVTDRARPVPLVAVRRYRAAVPRWFGGALQRILSRPASGPRERLLQVGYEGHDGEGCDDERWVRFYPDSRELDLSDWRDELGGGTDPYRDPHLRSAGELERRIRELGAAISSR